MPSKAYVINSLWERKGFIQVKAIDSPGDDFISSSPK